MNVIIDLFSAIDDAAAVSGAERVSDKEMESKNSWELHSNSNDSVSDNPPLDTPPPPPHTHALSSHVSLALANWHSNRSATCQTSKTPRLVTISS